MINQFICVSSDSGNIPAINVALFRLENNIWALNKGTRHKGKFSTGSKIVIYTAGTRYNSRKFIGKATVRDIVEFNRRHIKRYTKPTWTCTLPDLALELNDVIKFDNFVDIYTIKNDMDLFHDLKSNNWGSRLQGGVTLISKSDYKMIIKSSGKNYN